MRVWRIGGMTMTRETGLRYNITLLSYQQLLVDGDYLEAVLGYSLSYSLSCKK